MRRNLLSLVVVASIAWLVGCAGGESVANAPPKDATALAARAGVTLDPTGRWKAIDAQGAIATLEFKNGQITADTGCNPIGAEYVAHPDGRLEIGPVRSGKRYCEGRMAAEVRLAKSLSAAKSLRRDRARLELLDAAGAVVLTLDAE